MSLKHLLKLIRWPNLLMIFFVQYALRYLFILPKLEVAQFSININHFQFFLIALSTVLIAAGGYIINDIEDMASDSINKKEKRIVGVSIHEKTANNLYTFLTFAGVAIGFILTMLYEVKLIGFINVFTAGLLYFYSNTYKCIALVGNLVISVLTGMTMVLLLVTEPSAMANSDVKVFVSGFAVFAAAFTLIREIIKDIEDMKGDSMVGCKTLPIMIGSNLTKWIAAVLCGFIFALLLFSEYSWYETMKFVSEGNLSSGFFIVFGYVLAFVTIPVGYLTFQLIKADEKQSFTYCSKVAKLIMAAGIFSILVFYSSNFI
ncbi:MAG: geranylgeranylglycerol-phosphate geranylgeranyltransferase [Bacteroidota bacterium]